MLSLRLALVASTSVAECLRNHQHHKHILMYPQVYATLLSSTSTCLQAARLTKWMA